MGFFVKVFIIKGNLVFMNNLYHKLAVASVGMALGLALGANKEAKAATFTLTGISFGAEGSVEGERFTGGISVYKTGSFFGPADAPESRAFYEFNIGNLSLAPNTIISHAILNTPFSDLQVTYRFLFLDLVGYVGNGRPDLSDFNAGVTIARQHATTYDPYNPPFPRSGDFKFDVTNFVNQRVSNGDDFAGFGIRITDSSVISYPNYGSINLGNSYSGQEPSLIIETVDVAEPVPEPTTIFGSALALGVGGWLKRKKSSQRTKTTPQH